MPCHPGIGRREGDSPNPGMLQADGKGSILQQTWDRLTVPRPVRRASANEIRPKTVFKWPQHATGSG